MYDTLRYHLFLYKLHTFIIDFNISVTLESVLV